MKIANLDQSFLQESESFEQWKADLTNLGTIERHVQFYIGDKILEGETKQYIERGKYALIEELTGIAKMTLKIYVSTCKAISFRRRNELEFSHHREVVKLEDEKQEYYLEKAIENEWSVSSLRQAIKNDLYSQINNEITDVRVTPGDSNIYFQSSKYQENRYGDKIIDLQNDKKYYVLTTLERFFHKKTMQEFSLREYADLQTFPKDFKFIGSYGQIKKQIGNAVAPYMGAYITSNFKGKTIGDLFAGCGGLTCGAHQNGLESIWAVEWEKIAAQTYKLNYPDTRVFNVNVKNLELYKLDKVDIIVGGPPCQGFSIAGNRFINDPRNELYKEFVRIVDYMKPGEFLMENVKEIQEIKDQIIDDFQNIGYKVRTELVSGNEIGMKQNRVRFFFIGEYE